MYPEKPPTSWDEKSMASEEPRDPSAPFQGRWPRAPLGATDLMGNNKLRGERAPGASVRGKGTLGHPFGRYGREFRDPHGPRGAL
ncbi:hypothetical protein CRG98_011978 [Punica granatum]|uniref:Uncharacterized protein n=1 Tax=Punica granatum TaxID=22663 RepID=A0A2I0KGI8_PUNGR|nr:hypothetical protein CRG98_011978 [Punica granatum]